MEALSNFIGTEVNASDLPGWLALASLAVASAPGAYGVAVRAVLKVVKKVVQASYKVDTDEK